MLVVLRYPLTVLQMLKEFTLNALKYVDVQIVFYFVLIFIIHAYIVNQTVWLVQCIAQPLFNFLAKIISICDNYMHFCPESINLLLSIAMYYLFGNYNDSYNMLYA